MQGSVKAILNVLFIIACVLTAWSFFTEGWSAVWDVVGNCLYILFIIGGWELIRWAQRDPWRKCNAQGCTFRIRINNQQIADDIMRKHIMDHGMNAFRGYNL